MACLRRKLLMAARMLRVLRAGATGRAAFTLPHCGEPTSIDDARGASLLVPSRKTHSSGSSAPSRLIMIINPCPGCDTPSIVFVAPDFVWTPTLTMAVLRAPCGGMNRFGRLCASNHIVGASRPSHPRHSRPWASSARDGGADPIGAGGAFAVRGSCSSGTVGSDKCC